jgi:hypothetical protein
MREWATAGQTLDVTVLGASLGFNFSRAEAEQAFSPDDELSDFELEMVQSAGASNCGTSGNV